jgi:hypothetical protein
MFVELAQWFAFGFLPMQQVDVVGLQFLYGNVA